MLDDAEVSLDAGIAGDFRGAMRGKSYKRQITLIESDDWVAATAEVGVVLPWQERRSNLLVEALDLPQRAGARLRIGTDVLLEVTREADPCERMESLAAGLKGALMSDWRGGVCAFVVTGGRIAVGDEVMIEEQA